MSGETVLLYDDENNVTIPRDIEDTREGRVRLSALNHLRLAVATEFMRTKVYGLGGIDAALDDADTALGMLNRLGVLTPYLDGAR